MSTCKHCNQKILWGHRGKHWIPIDPHPTPQGRWAKINNTHVELHGVQRETAHMLKHPLHPPHNCPTRREVGHGTE